MDNIEFIKTRRSVRKYKDKDIPEEVIKDIIDTGMSAPSAVNAQPWHFLVTTSPETLEEISERHPYAKMTAAAKAGILVCADPKLEKIPGFFPQDCSAATQNILLAAHAYGLGAVWCGVYPNGDLMETFREIFEIPGEITPFAFIPMGYPAEKTGKVDRYGNQKVHYEKW